MSGLIILFCSVQISLVLHNESLRAAIRAHWPVHPAQLRPLRLVPADLRAALFLSHRVDAIVRSAIADRLAGVIIWKMIYVVARGLVTGWLLASWVCLFRQCETGRVNQESWIRVCDAAARPTTGTDCTDGRVPAKITRREQIEPRARFRRVRRGAPRATSRSSTPFAG